MTRKRRVAYVSGTRADFGLMRRTLDAINADPKLELSILATGMHLDPDYGCTIREVEETGLPIGARFEVERGAPSGARMARNIGMMLTAFTTTFEADRPDIVLLLGDRGEMLAAAIAAIHLNIPIAHVHGGERSGTVDEPVRHAISKLAHLHLAATEGSRRRLIAMGEDPKRVVVVGAPGLDGIEADAARAIAPVFQKPLDPTRPLALFVYHPVLQESGRADATSTALDVLINAGAEVLALKPNSDAGSTTILDVLSMYSDRGQIHLVTHLARNEYLSFLKRADLLVGNSSSGIIEAATFGTPVVNIGSRQNLRERNANVIDAITTPQSIDSAVRAALAGGRLMPNNIYGDGNANARIVTQLLSLDLSDPSLMAKTNAY